MANYSKITIGVGKYSDIGHRLAPIVHSPNEELKKKILQRDGYTCKYCGFVSSKYQEVNFIGNGVSPKEDPRQEIKIENYVTSCSFCHQCFHIEKIDRMQSGTIIWLPEIGQAALNHIMRAIYVARISRGPMAEAAKTALETLLLRRQTAESILGTSDISTFSSVLNDFLELSEYKNRDKKLEGFKILPLDRRIIVENGLEFNQFPQVLAYWRSNQGPFGNFQVRDWEKMFSEVKNIGN